MTFEEIDRALSSWNQRLAAIADNLLELQSDPTYQVLTGSGGTTPIQLAGETARRVLPALKPLDTIFHQFSLLQSAIDRAAQLRKDLPVFGREQALREIEALLVGESIQLPADAVTLKDRTLLSGVRGSLVMRPEQLLANMAQAFGEARDAVVLVSSAWDELAHEVDAAETEMRRLRALATAAGCGTPKSLAVAEDKLAGLKGRIETDPVTARNGVKVEVFPELARAAHELELRQKVKRQMAAAGEMLDRLRALEAETVAAAATTRGKILGSAPAADPAPSPASAGLEAWLIRLQQRNGEERPQTMARGLDNWHSAMNKAIEENVQALQQERAPLETRSELRGRLDALKAKARVYGVAEDAALSGLAGQAEELLYARPTDLPRAAAAVEVYERRLAAPAPPKHQGRGSNEEHR